MAKAAPDHWPDDLGNHPARGASYVPFPARPVRPHQWCGDCGRRACEQNENAFLFVKQQAYRRRARNDFLTSAHFRSVATVWARLRAHAGRSKSGGDVTPDRPDPETGLAALILN